MRAAVIREHGDIDDVDIQGPRPPANLPDTAVPGLDVQTHGQQFMGRERRLDDRDGVEEVILIRAPDGRGPIDRRHGKDADPPLRQEIQGTLQMRKPVTHVGPHRQHRPADRRRHERSLTMRSTTSLAGTPTGASGLWSATSTA